MDGRVLEAAPNRSRPSAFAVLVVSAVRVVGVE